MNKKSYCRKLLDYRDRDMPWPAFLGRRWIILKVLIIALGGLLLSFEPTGVKVLGGMVIGYALGRLVAGLMSYRAAKATWPWMRDLVDWQKVSKTGADNPRA
jgi:hypothetical protein